MSQATDDFEALRRLLLDMARERDLDALLTLIVNRAAERDGVALARVWLVRPGGPCAACPLRADCADDTTCLHLVASDGVSLDGEERFDRLDGPHHRVPLSSGIIGRVAATGAGLNVADIRIGDEASVLPEWALRQGIVSASVQPLAFRDEVLGVVAVSSRRVATQADFDTVRIIADHAAAAIAHARAFDQIQALRARLEMENTYLKEEVERGFGDLVGRSPALRQVLDQIDLVAPTDATVLVHGESGTGKELVARELHRRSARADRPMIKVNCASIPHELFEAEFFGHGRGAFTGATGERIGRFAAADGGTLMLDEVGEIPLSLQPKLLRVLQEGQYERVGEDRTRSVDVRVVAATNRDLRAEVDAGRFRQDLYYRLNVFPIEVAPLRARKTDIPLLARHFVDEAAARFRRETPALTQAHVMQLQAYDWPGNVRELQNVVERAVITAAEGRLRFDLPTTAAAPAPPPRAADDEDAVLTEDELRARERRNLVRALSRCDWRVSGPDGAAALLGIKPTTLNSRIKAWKIHRPAG